MKGYIFGSNFGSQLARPPSFDDTYKPVAIDFFKDKPVQKVACGVMHNIVLAGGKVYSWGCNDEGALGRNGDEEEVLEVVVESKKGRRAVIEKTKRVIGRIEEIVDVSCGASHSAALSKNGNVYAWGTFRDSSGVIGFKPKTRIQSSPILINRNVRLIGSTDNVVVMVTKTGAIECYGAEMFNERDRLIRKSKMKEIIKVKKLIRGSKKLQKTKSLGMGSNHFFLIDEEGNVESVGNNVCGQQGIGNKVSSNEKRPVNRIKDVKKISGGSMHSIFLTKNKEVYAVGQNNFGQLGNESKEELEPVRILKNVKDIASRGSMNLALKEDGIYSWGANFNGELGYEGSEKNHMPKKIDYDFGKVISINCGNNHSFIISK